MSVQIRTNKGEKIFRPTHVEEVKSCPRVVTGLLESQVKETAVDTLFWVESGVSLDLETLGELVLNLKLRLDHVGGSPGVGKDGTVFWLGVLGLEVTNNVSRLGVVASSDLEGDIGGSLGLNLETNSLEWVIPS
jgi:hypothetical protein